MTPTPGDEVGGTPRVPVDPDLAPPPPTPVSRDSTAGVAVMAHLRRQTGALLAADAGLDRDAPGSVHAARVAARRLRSGLRVYGDLLRDDVAAQLRPELAWYAGALSPVRDLEVFADSLADSGDDVHGFGDALLPWVHRRLGLAHRAALDDARSARADALRHSLVSVARAPSFTNEAARKAPKVLAPRVLRADERAARLIEQLHPNDDSGSWHSARITAKRARYAAEVGAPVLGKECDGLAHLWAALTAPLGDAQDAVIQRALVLDRVDDSSAPLSAGEAFVCGVYVASTHDREVACHRLAGEVWRASRDEHKHLRKALGR
jgi:CHAD domain-containing protein